MHVFCESNMLMYITKSVAEVNTVSVILLLMEKDTITSSNLALFLGGEYEWLIFIRRNNGLTSLYKMSQHI